MLLSPCTVRLGLDDHFKFKVLSHFHQCMDDLTYKCHCIEFWLHVKLTVPMNLACF